MRIIVPLHDGKPGYKDVKEARDDLVEIIHRLAEQTISVAGIPHFTEVIYTCATTIKAGQLFDALQEHPLPVLKLLNNHSELNDAFTELSLPRHSGMTHDEVMTTLAGQAKSSLVKIRDSNDKLPPEKKIPSGKMAGIDLAITEIDVVLNKGAFFEFRDRNKSVS